MRQGTTIWLTGLPSAGKSTLALALARILRAGRCPVEILDGDEVRANLSPDLGYQRADRIENVRRIGWLAQLLARNGVAVLVPAIAPYAESRETVRKVHDAAGIPYVEVYIATPLDVCRSRDVKGLYARQARGEISGLTGVDDPYERPEFADLVIDTAGVTAAQCAEDILAHLVDRGLL